MVPQITIGLPFHNPGQRFAQTLQSIFAQTFQDWELILVDDGSSDDSLSLARGLQDPRVRFVSDGQRRGLSARLNQIAQLCRTKYLARMDADDLMHPRRLEEQVRELLRHNCRTVVGSDAYSLNEQSTAVGYKIVTKKQRFDFSARHSFIHPTVAASTDWFRRNPYTPDPIHFRSEDVELWCRSTATSTFVNLPQPLLFYREAGVFSFRNYAASQLGVLSILHQRFRVSKGRYMRLVGRELLKVWVASVYDVLGYGDRFVARRSRRLTPEERDAANEALGRINAQQLPLGENREPRQAAVGLPLGREESSSCGIG